MADASARFGSQPDLVSAWLFFICDSPTPNRESQLRAQIFLDHRKDVARIVAVQRQDVEGVELDLVIVLPAVQPIEIRDAVYAKQYGFAIEDELACSDTARRLDDQRITACPVMAVASEQPDAIAIARDDQPESVLLYFVYPVRVVGNLGPAGRDARQIRIPAK
jgi:hypothetical protein